MGQSFDLRESRHAEALPRRVLITGAGGRIGSFLAKSFRERYELRLMVQFAEQAAKVEGCGEVVVADLLDLARMKEVCAGIDTVVHLAASPRADATWSELMPLNIVGTYHAMVAAKAAGCRRLIFASSIHAVSGYPPDAQVKTSEPVHPGDLYGVTKCFGEALGRYMATGEGLSVIALRIGAFSSPEHARREAAVGMLDSWTSDRDLAQLVHRCIDDEALQFAIFHAISNNLYKRLDISDARELLGYAPLDDLAAENPLTREANLHHGAHSHREAGPGHPSGLREEVGE